MVSNLGMTSLMGKGRVSLLLVIILLACSFFTIINIVPVNVRAATLYVGGSGLGNYTRIQDAIDNATAGETVFVYNGTYREQLNVNKTISLIAENVTNTIIDGGAIGHVINVTADWVNITGFRITNGSSGESTGAVMLYNVSHCNISGNNISMNQGTGIVAHDANDSLLSYNEISENGMYAIRLESSDNSMIWNNKIDNNQGIFVEDSYGVSVANNTGSTIYGGCAVRFLYSDRGMVGNNSFTDVILTGVCIEHSTNATVIGNVINRSSVGVYLEYSANISVGHNMISNVSSGVYTVLSDNCTINDNDIQEIGNQGIGLDTTSGIVITRNTVSNSVMKTSTGIVLLGTQGANVSFNQVHGNEYGIGLGSSDLNTVSNNTLDFNNWGISLYFAENNTFADNTISPYQDSGISIFIEDSANDIFVGNTMTDNGFFIWGRQSLYWDSHIIEDSNTVNGRPVRYLNKANGGVIPSGASQVLIGNCTNILIEGQSLNKVNTGIEIGYSSNITVRNNTIFDDFNGIIDDHSKNNTFTGNNVSHNVYAIDVRYSDGHVFLNNTISNNTHYGIKLSDSGNGTIEGNFLSNSSFDAAIYLLNSMDNDVVGNEVYLSQGGIYLGPADGNTVSRNKVSGNLYGISIASSKQNTITENDIVNNEYGLSFGSTASGTVHHNNFLNNANQTYGSSNSLQWDDGYPSGGNYWSDYKGFDNMSGPAQNIPGGDGIGDTPRPIVGTSSEDRYPLMYEIGPPPWRPSAPLNLQASAGDRWINLTWDAPVTDGGSIITNYTIYRGLMPGSEMFYLELGVVSSHNDSSLTNGQPYYYKVSAKNAVGEGPVSNEVSATPAALPGPPLSLTASAGDMRVDLTWAPPSDTGGFPIANYVVYRGMSPGTETYLIMLGNVLSHSDIGLTNGLTYYYTVAAITTIGHGPNSTEANATPQAVPSEPLNLQSTPGNGQVMLTWSAPVSDGGSPVTNYTIYRGITSGGETLLVEIGDLLAYTDSTVINGQTYYYKVAAKNAVGEGPQSLETSATPGTTPGPPIGLTAIPGNGQITLSWSPPADNGGFAITDYTVYRGSTPGGETFLIKLGNVLTYQDTGLSNGLAYYYKVSAWNTLGEGQNSSEASAIPATTPMQPSDLSAVAGIGQITLYWIPPIDNGGSSVIGYNVYKGTSPGGETFLVSLGNVLTYVDASVSEGITYYYQVAARNSVGVGSRSIERSATPPTEPTEPRNLQALAGIGSVRLTWTAPASDGGIAVTNYTIYRGTNPGGEVFLVELGNILSYMDVAVVIGQTYFYQVSAKNAVGEGPMSTEASAIPISGPTAPSAPLNLLASAGNSQVTLTWSAPASDGGAPIIIYRIYAGTESGNKSLVAETGNVLTFVDTALENGMTYFYQVAALNSAGEGPKSNEASAMPRTVPGQPLGLIGTPGNKNVTLRWSAPAENGGSAITGYRIFRGTLSGNLVLLESLGNVLTYLDTGLVNSQVYYYKISAVNAIGEGAASGIISVMPWNRPPTCLISSPLHRANVLGTVTLAGSSSDQDGSVVKVEISVDGGAWQTVFGTGSWTYSWDTKTVPDGEHTITARSFDGDSYSNLARITVNVVNEAPQGGDSSWVPIVIVLFLAGIGAFYIFRMRRKKEEKKEPPLK